MNLIDLIFKYLDIFNIKKEQFFKIKERREKYI